MESKQNSNIINFKKPFQFNIGRIIFAVLFVYLVIIVISYAFKSHISAYEVQLGSLATNNTYTALAVRKETIIRTDHSGYITYFAKENTKISSKSKIYGLSNEKPGTSNLIKGEYSKEELAEIKEILDDYFYTYDNNSFYQTYNFQNSLNANLFSASITGSNNEILTQDMSVQYGITPGIIIYNIDGLESVTTSNFTDEEVHSLNYSSKNLLEQTEVSKGDPVYKIVTDENWSLVIEVTPSVIRMLEDKKSVKICFTEDDFTYNASFESLVKNGKYYLVLHLTNHMIRYADQRYIEIELITDAATGYKIPTSSVIEELFVKIPVQYATKGGSSNQDGFLKQEKNKDGTLTTVFYPVDLYKQEEGCYYVLATQFNIGDKIIIPSTGETYMINEKIPLKGVYNINKGYAVFRLIDILYRNEDYCIIAINTPYGVSNYDHIVLDGSKVTNGQMIN